MCRRSSTAKGLTVDCPASGQLTLDVAYGGNFYAIIEPQANYAGLDALSAADILRLSPIVRPPAEREALLRPPRSIPPSRG